MRYKTKDGQDYTLPGIGRTVNGMIETDQEIENPNFELIQDAQDNSRDTMTAAPTGEAMIAPPVASVAQETVVDAPQTTTEADPQVNEQQETN